MTIVFLVEIVSSQFVSKSKLAFRGSNVTFSCNSSSMPRWYKDGVWLRRLSGMGEDLVLKSVMPKDSGTYQL